MRTLVYSNSNRQCSFPSPTIIPQNVKLPPAGSGLCRTLRVSPGIFSPMRGSNLRPKARRHAAAGFTCSRGVMLFWCERGESDGGGTDGDSWEKPPLCSQRGADGSARHKSQTIYKPSKTNQKITSPKSNCRTNLLLSVRSRKTKGLCLLDGQTQTDAVSSLNKDLKTETDEAVRLMMQLSSPSGNFLLKTEIKNLRLSLFVSVWTSLTSRVSQTEVTPDVYVRQRKEHFEL